MPISRRATVIPVPINVLPAQKFLGYDGSWSTFQVSVGTPPQTFNVLPSTLVSETWVILPDGCISSDPSDCQTERGGVGFNGRPAAGFLTNESSTWESIGLYNLEAEQNLGFSSDDSGVFGNDTVSLNGGNGSSGGVSISSTTVGGIATKDFFLGVLGLSIAPSSFTSSAAPAKTLLERLLELNLIPSLSYSYTAGAQYVASRSSKLSLSVNTLMVFV
jgi:hypothetical protein